VKQKAGIAVLEGSSRSKGERFMAMAAALQNEIWLQATNYSVVSLNSKLSPYIPELTMALRNGVPAYPDSGRDGFYDVELNHGWGYIHVHDDARTVYMVAFSRN
jgi:hypothetical protein